MSAWCPRKSIISYVIRKPEPLGKFIIFLFIFSLLHLTPFTTLFSLGTEFKNIACCRIGFILALEIQRGKEGM